MPAKTCGSNKQKKAQIKKKRREQKAIMVTPLRKSGRKKRMTPLAHWKKEKGVGSTSTVTAAQKSA